MPSYDQELKETVRLVQAAGRLLLDIYETDFEVRYKGPSDPVTEADTRVNEFLVKNLQAAFPRDGVVSEEANEGTLITKAERIWYVDPLDGTHEFISKNGEFSIMVGLAVGGRPQMGVVYRPVGEILYAGLSEQGAWLSKHGKNRPLTVSTRRDPSTLGLVVSRSHRDVFIDRLRDGIGIRQESSCGSVGLKIGLIAEQRADLYMEASGKTSAWDTCGPHAILHGAGGRLTDLWGAPLTYDPEHVRNRRGLVASNGACHDDVLRAIAPHLHELNR